MTECYGKCKNGCLVGGMIEITAKYPQALSEREINAVESMRLCLECKAVQTKDETEYVGGY